MSRFTIGVDFGTNSARAVVVSIADGHEVAAAVYPYRGGRQGIILDPHDANLARQDAREYVAALEQAIPRLNQTHSCYPTLYIISTNVHHHP